MFASYMFVVCRRSAVVSLPGSGYMQVHKLTKNEQHVATCNCKDAGQNTDHNSFSLLTMSRGTIADPALPGQSSACKYAAGPVACKPSGDMQGYHP